MKELRKYAPYLFLLLMLIGIILVEYYKPKPVDWTPTFVNTDKIPYGTYITYEQLSDIFPNKKIKKSREPVFNKFKELENDQALKNFIFIGSNFNLNDVDAEVFLEFIEKGNSAFISSNDIGLGDSLKVELSYASHIRAPYMRDDDVLAEIKNLDSLYNNGANFINPDLHKKGGYRSVKRLEEYAFTIAYDSTITTVLGTNKYGSANFITMEIGEGRLFLSSNPYVFTNVNMLDKETTEYASKLLSHLPVNDVIWDEFYRQGREGSKSVFRYFLQNESLRWFLFIALFGVLMYAILESRRRQRAIPVVAPLTNTSIEYAQTLARLYESKKDHKNLAEKKILYFHDFIRTKLYLKEIDNSDNFIGLLASKTGIDNESLKKLMDLIENIQANDTIFENDLIALNRGIEGFYKELNQMTKI